jgi:hypothetical protein
LTWRRRRLLSSKLLLHVSHLNREERRIQLRPDQESPILVPPEGRAVEATILSEVVEIPSVDSDLEEIAIKAVTGKAPADRVAIGE